MVYVCVFAMATDPIVFVRLSCVLGASQKRTEAAEGCPEHPSDEQRKRWEAEQASHVPIAVPQGAGQEIALVSFPPMAEECSFMGSVAIIAVLF